jgi:hypothetical protein
MLSGQGDGVNYAMRSGRVGAGHIDGSISLRCMLYDQGVCYAVRVASLSAVLMEWEPD